MSERQFKTSEVLAAIHSFPGIIAARENGSIVESFDRLRQLTQQMASIECSQDHISWCEVSQALRPVLKAHFAQMASEFHPDYEYWKDPQTILPEKVRNLARWVVEMEEKYGETLVVPDISREVIRNLDPRP